MEKHKENELESGMEELELVLAGEEQAAPLVSAEEDFVLPGRSGRRRGCRDRS